MDEICNVLLEQISYNVIDESAYIEYSAGLQKPYRTSRNDFMNRHYSVSTYRAIDLTLFAVILFVFESVIIRVASSPVFRDQAFTVSLAAAITSIVFIRWGYWGGIHAALAGLVLCVLSSGSLSQLAVYVIGNLFSLAAVPFIRKAGPEKMLRSKFLYLLTGLGVLLLMQFGRSVVSLILGSGWAEAFRFFTTDSLSAVFTLVILWIAHRLDGICEDQLRYLTRVNRETDE